MVTHTIIMPSSIVWKRVAPLLKFAKDMERETSRAWMEEVENTQKRPNGLTITWE